MKHFFEDPTAIAFLLLIVSPAVGLSVYFIHQENSLFRQNLKTVLECRKSVELTQMDKICGPIPQRGGSK
jgi:hypothetical protein